MKQDPREIAQRFNIEGRVVSAEPMGTGHINDTFLVDCVGKASRQQYTLQRINTDVFKDAIALMENFQRVTAHLRRKLETQGATDLSRRVLTLIQAKDDLCYVKDDHDDVWRMYVFVGNAYSRDTIKNPLQAQHAAATYGDFVRQLADLPGARLHETIPDFHDTPKRFRALEEVIDSDPVNRAQDAKREISFALEHKGMTTCLIEKLQEALIPERIIHNDTKLNNILFDETTNDAICVIDLDTVMPGLIHYDFGDMVRSATTSGAEDEADVSSIHMRMPVFKALVDGYLTSLGDVLNDTEKEYLAFSGKLITFEIGIRFLADFLGGDTYFKVEHETHNLLRARAQFKLVESIIEQEEAMNSFVASWKPA